MPGLVSICFSTKRYSDTVWRGRLNLNYQNRKILNIVGKDGMNYPLIIKAVIATGGFIALTIAVVITAVVCRILCKKGRKGMGTVCLDHFKIAIINTILFNEVSFSHHL